MEKNVEDSPIKDGERLSQKEYRCDLQELRIVLLGHSWLDKSLTGNIILDQKMFDVSRDVKMCVRRQGVLANGRKVVVVSTPESWIRYSVEDPGLVNEHIASCMSMCSPGPHAFLMVVPVGFSEGWEWTVEGPLQLLNDSLWRNTMIIFTRGEKLRGDSVKNYTAKHRFLQEIKEKCMNRYQLLNTSVRVEAQIAELMGKIDAMVRENVKSGGAGYITPDEDVSGMTEREKNAVKERAALRRMTAQTTRSTLRSLMGKSPSTAALQIVVVGPRKVGKTSTANMILGREDFATGRPTSRCTKKQREVGATQVAVIDTPGWNGRYFADDTPQEIRHEIALSVSLCVPLPHAVLMAVRADESYTETDRTKAEELLNSLGRLVWTQALVLFTWGGNLRGTAIEEHIERWPALQWLVDKCGNRYHVFDDSSGAQVEELLKKIEEMVVQNDTGLMLKSLVKFKRKNRRLVQRSKKAKRLLKKMEVEYEYLRQTLEDIEKDEQFKSARAEMENKQGQGILKSLTEAEKENEDLKLALMSKDRMITKLSEKCVEKDNAVEATEQDAESATKSKDEEKARKQEDNAALRKICEEKDKERGQVMLDHKREVEGLQETIKLLTKENEDTRSMLEAIIKEKKRQPLNEESENEKNFAFCESEEDIKTSTNLRLQCALPKPEMKQQRLTKLDFDVMHGEKTDTTDQESLEPDTFSVWLTAGGTVLGAAVGALAASCKLPMGSGARSAVGALTGALLGTLLLRETRLQLQEKHNKNRQATNNTTDSLETSQT